MSNGYTAIHGNAFERIEANLRHQGYVCRIACTYDSPTGRPPEDLRWTGKEGGWEMRRIIKAWCAKHGITDYRIVRNTGYVRDLHGDVYELWTKQDLPTA